MTVIEVPLCGAVTPGVDHNGDCVCLLDQHGVETEHECATESCRRQWVGHQPAAGRTA